MRATTSPCLVITGATGGIGLATARLALEQGWNLVLTGRSIRVHEAAAQIGPPERVRGIVADSTDPDALAEATELANGVFGGLAAAFVNAGVTAGPVTYLPGSTAPVEGWREMVLTNVLGTALAVRAVLPALLASRGRLVLTGSVLGRHALSGSLYSATKFAVAAIAETVRLELVGTGVGVTLIAPGPVDTPFGAGSGTTGPALNADDVARAVCFALAQPDDVEINELLLRPHGAAP